ncbi:MAG: nickel-dependent hydrogenase large subunit [Candidatus Nezhaarchaeota archaeon]|nr:nickel-dependent hydrogenase large subunit [Candidatus Nezhaarchaeota archaeon]MCX8142315.1 nickel-dependent hydrogenase large subunit [Candidatus Nezhaarchaeota archaeon]MDW8050712.1 nickel-dependent hydrogenase large subunit [Nitrososphaerota archaeon]
MSTTDLVVGPIHPALHEPARFVFKVDGEVVVDVEPRVGYVHRGIEKAMTERTYIKGIYLVERICGICNVAHTLTAVQAIEDAFGVEVPRRAKYLRTLVHELNRVHSHLLILGIFSELIGFETLFMLLWRDREAVMDLIEMVTGNRVMSAYNIIGGVRRNIRDFEMAQIRSTMSSLVEKVKRYKEVFINDPTIRARSVDVGYLSRSKAIALGAVGPIARGSGLEVDVRVDEPYAAFDEVSCTPVVYSDGDTWARFMVRLDEILEAINIINQCLDKMPSGPVKVPVPEAALKTSEGFSVIEAPRGELIHHVYVKEGNDKPLRYRIRTPTYANIPAVCEMLKGGYIADIPAALVSIDPCFSCNDRLAIVDINSGMGRIVDIFSLARRFKK